MMMGTADEIVKAPEKGPLFAEDLPEEQQVVDVVRFIIIYMISCNSKNAFNKISVYFHTRACKMERITVPIL